MYRTRSPRNLRKRNWRRRLGAARGKRFGLLGAPAARAGWSRARAINRHELRGNEAGQAVPQRYAHDGHDDHGRADQRREATSVTSAVHRQHAADVPADPKNDPKPGKNGNSGRPLSPRVVSLFSLCYLLLEKLSKSLIPLSDCPFVLNRLPVFLENLPVSRKKQGRQLPALLWSFDPPGEPEPLGFRALAGADRWGLYLRDPLFFARETPRLSSALQHDRPDVFPISLVFPDLRATNRKAAQISGMTVRYLPLRSYWQSAACNTCLPRSQGGTWAPHEGRSRSAE